MTTGKEHGLNISTSVLVSWVGLAGFVWLFAEPLFVSTMRTALADDIKQTVAESVAPINGAFIALLQRDIATTTREIAALEYRKTRTDSWLSADATYLADKKLELKALEAAKKSLETTL